MKNYKSYGKKAIQAYPAVSKRVSVYGPAVKQLASDVMYLKGLINTEPMTFTFQSANNYDYTGTVLSCCDLVQGDQAGNRTGNRVLPRYFSLKLHINQGINAAYVNHCTHRIIIFRWWGEAAHGGVIVPAEILQTTGSQFAPVSHLNVQATGPKGDRTRCIEVLRNDEFTLDQVSGTCKDIAYNITMNSGGKKYKEHIEFPGNTTTQPSSGGIFVLLINDNATAGQQSYVLESRLTFYDN